LSSRYQGGRGKSGGGLGKEKRRRRKEDQTTQEKESKKSGKKLFDRKVKKRPVDCGEEREISGSNKEPP